MNEKQRGASAVRHLVIVVGFIFALPFIVKFGNEAGLLFESSSEKTARIQRELDAARAANLAKPMSRWEFESTLVKQCASSSGLPRVGIPDSTQQSGDREYWYYRGKSVDPVTGKVDMLAQVVMKYGCVESVNFN